MCYSSLNNVLKLWALCCFVVRKEVVPELRNVCVLNGVRLTTSLAFKTSQSQAERNASRLLKHHNAAGD